MDDGNSWIGILLFAGAVVLFFIMYGFGAAIQAVNTSALEDEQSEGNKRAGRLLHIQENPYYFIRTNQAVTCLLCLVLGEFLLVNVVKQCQILFRQSPDIPEAVIFFLAHGAGILGLTFLLTCAGIVIPKRMACKRPVRFCYQVLPVVDVVIKLMFPFTWLIDGLAFVILKIMGIDIRDEDENVTEEDIMYMVNEGHEQGVLEAREAEMITNIFEFDDKMAGDIMTHRKNVVALDGKMTLKEAAEFIIKEAKNSRLPVYGEDIDDVIGILHLRDALYFSELTEFQNTPIGEIDGLLRTPHMIPEAKNINALFKEMQSEKIHMAIVVDEYGQTAGIVTMEDILEEIVGNIMDEYDEEEPEIAEKENHTYELAGLTPLADVEDALGIQFDEEDKANFNTLNGLLVFHLGHLPKLDERSDIEAAGFVFHITGVANKTIQTVVAEPVSSRKEETESDEDREKQS